MTVRWRSQMGEWGIRLTALLEQIYRPSWYCFIAVLCHVTPSMTYDWLICMGKLFVHLFSSMQELDGLSGPLHHVLQHEVVSGIR